MADDGLQSIYKALTENLDILEKSVGDLVKDEYAREMLKFDARCIRTWVKRAINYQPE